MLSKLKGQILRVAAVFHVYFLAYTTWYSIYYFLTSAASSRSFSGVVQPACCFYSWKRQHLWYYISHRWYTNRYLFCIIMLILECLLAFLGEQKVENESLSHRYASYSLLLPGKVLHFNAWTPLLRGSSGTKEAWQVQDKLGRSFKMQDWVYYKDSKLAVGLIWYATYITTQLTVHCVAEMLPLFAEWALDLYCHR